MRKAYKELLLLLFCLLVGCALPALAWAVFGNDSGENGTVCDGSTLLYCTHEGEAEGRELTLRELLVGTLAAYNSAETPAESLKAQAVALRSRALCLIGYCREDERSLCDSPSHGLYYLDADALTAMYGEKEALVRRKAAEQAVDAVRDEVLLYEGHYALALTHDSSPKRTKAMEGYPYLASVPTPEEESVNEYRLTRREFAERTADKFGISCSEGEDWAIELVTADDQRVETVKICGKSVSGGDFAEAMGLISDAFTLKVGEELIFTCRGVGSGYGLSREGAARYAEQGLGYREILTHYFPGAELTHL